MELRHSNAVAYIQSSEDMSAVEDESVRLLLCGCTHLGGWDTWSDYLSLINRVIVDQADRVLHPDGRLVVFQTDAYVDGQIMPRASMLLNALTPEFRHLDTKIWKRKNADFRQPPWSTVYVMAPLGSRGSRPNAKNVDYFQGVWDYPQTARGKLNSWPDALCRLLVETFTEPGDLVVDPFAGSCRILAVASQLGRRAVGYEIDEDLIPLIRTNLKATPFKRDLTGNLL